MYNPAKGWHCYICRINGATDHASSYRDKGLSDFELEVPMVIFDISQLSVRYIALFVAY